MCGNPGKRTREDVLPLWLNRHMGVSQLPFQVFNADGLIRESKGFNLVLNDICETCNHGWMSALEGEFKAALGGAILGERRVVIDPPAMKIAATWATKQALLFEHSLPLAGYAPPASGCVICLVSSTILLRYS